MSNLKKACEMALNEEMEKMDKAYAVSLIDGHIDRPTHTDNEIIKALESYKNDIGCMRCGVKDNYLLTTINNTLDLINRQQAENEELKTAMNCYRSYEEEQIAIAIKEFAERLNEKTIATAEYCEVVLGQDIDNLVKEMVGEE